MTRARLPDGTLAALIGPNPNGGYVIRHDNGDFATVEEFTAEFGQIRQSWITGIYQGTPDFGIGSWPSLDAALQYQRAQLHTFSRVLPLGQIMPHGDLVILTDTHGQPLRGAS